MAFFGNNIKQMARELTAAPVEAHGYRVQPIARMAGWWGELPTDGSVQNAMGGGAFLQLTPVAVQVEQAGQPPYRISLESRTEDPLRGMMVGAVVLALVAGVINLLIHLRIG